MKEIRLYGELGRRFGRVHKYAVANIAEAIRALSANFPDFEKVFAAPGAGYKVWSGTTRLSDAREIHNPTSDAEVIRISPVVQGAGKGLGQVILGAIMVIAAVVMAPVTGGGSLMMASEAFSVMGMSITYGNIAMMGVSMMLQGVSTMLASSAKLDASSGETANNKPSYVFNGAVNTTAQGHPVPIGYGRMRVGSAVISAGISSVDIST